MKNYFIFLIASTAFLPLHAQTPINHQYHNLFDDPVNEKSTFVQRSAFSDELLSMYSFNSVFDGQEVDVGLGLESEVFVCDSIGGYIIFRSHDEQTLETTQSFSIRTSSDISHIPVRHCDESILADVTLLPETYFVLEDNTVIQNSHENQFINYLIQMTPEGNYIRHREVWHHEDSLRRTLRYPHNTHMGLLTGPFNGAVEVYDFAFKDSITVFHNQFSSEHYQPNFSIYTEVFDTNTDSLYSGLIEGNGRMRWHGSIAINEMVMRLISVNGSIDLDPGETENWYTTPDNEHHLILAGYNAVGELVWTNLLAAVQAEDPNSGYYEAQLLNVGDQVLIDHLYRDLSQSADFSGNIEIYANESIVEDDTLQFSGVFNKSARYATVLDLEISDVTAVYSIRLNGEDGGSLSTHAPTILPFDDTHFMIHEDFLLYQNPDWSIERIYPDQYLYQSADAAGTQHQVNYHIIPVNSLTGHQSYVLNLDADPSDTWVIMMNPAKGNNGDIYFSGVISGYVNFDFPQQESVLVMADFTQWDGIFMKCSKLTTSISETNASFSVYPNPANDRLYVQGAIGEQFSYSVLSVDGKLIESGFNVSSGSIPVDHLLPGAYLIRLEESSGSIQAVRFLKN